MTVFGAQMEDFVYDVLNNDNWWWSVGRRALVKSLLNEYGPRRHDGTPPRILEIGCGAGAVLEDLKHFGVPYGLDVSAVAAGHWRERGLDCVSLADCTALPFKAQEFDAIIAIDVLEHVEDDMEAIREIHRVCRPGARVILTVPAFQFLWSRRDVQCHHYRRYTVKDLRHRVRRGGFRTLRATYINMPLFFPLAVLVKAGQLSSRRAPSMKMDYALVPPPVNKLLSRVVEYETRLLRHISLPVGSSIACVAERREAARAADEGGTVVTAAGVPLP